MNAHTIRSPTPRLHITWVIANHSDPRIGITSAVSTQGNQKVRNPLVSMLVKTNRLKRKIIRKTKPFCSSSCAECHEELRPLFSCLLHNRMQVKERKKKALLVLPCVAENTQREKGEGLPKFWRGGVMLGAEFLSLLYLKM